MLRRQLRAVALTVPIAAVLGMGSVASAEPQVSIPCDVTALNNAIVAANNNTGPHTIRLAPKCVYNVTNPASTGGSAQTPCRRSRAPSPCWVTTPPSDGTPTPPTPSASRRSTVPMGA